MESVLFSSGHRLYFSTELEPPLHASQVQALFIPEGHSIPELPGARLVVFSPAVLSFELKAIRVLQRAIEKRLRKGPVWLCVPTRDHEAAFRLRVLVACLLLSPSDASPAGILDALHLDGSDIQCAPVHDYCHFLRPSYTPPFLTDGGETQPFELASRLKRWSVAVALPLLLAPFLCAGALFYWLSTAEREDFERKGLAQVTEATQAYEQRRERARLCARLLANTATTSQVQRALCEGVAVAGYHAGSGPGVGKKKTSTEKKWVLWSNPDQPVSARLEAEDIALDALLEASPAANPATEALSAQTAEGSSALREGIPRTLQLQKQENTWSGEVFREANQNFFYYLAPFALPIQGLVVDAEGQPLQGLLSPALEQALAERVNRKQGLVHLAGGTVVFDSLKDGSAVLLFLDESNWKTRSLQQALAVFFSQLGAGLLVLALFSLLVLRLAARVRALGLSLRRSLQTVSSAKAPRPERESILPEQMDTIPEEATPPAPE